MLNIGPQRLQLLILDAALFAEHAAVISDLRNFGFTVFAETSAPQWPAGVSEESVDGLVLKGNESGGFVGEDSSFILLQRWRAQTNLALVVRGGVSLQVAVAAAALETGGVVLDDQLLLLRESPLAASLETECESLAGNETVTVGDAEHGAYFRLLVRPLYTGAKQLVADAEGKTGAELASLVNQRVGWHDFSQALLPAGQAICFASAYQKRYKSVAGLAAAIRAAIKNAAVQMSALASDAPLARSLGVKYPLVQGPMTRVSDTPGFAKSVADGGALPMLALALMKGEGLRSALAETSELLEEQTWGIGLLGFAPQALLDEQIAVAREHKPDFAIIAGGRPDQSAQLDELGIPSFLHVPSANLLGLFLQNGARRFILEGRECGGHIGPLSSFVLWSAMVDRLVAELEATDIAANEIQLLFAGGIHDAFSSAMVQAIAAPLVARGVQIGLLMGSAYLFTREIVESGAVQPEFQQTAADCVRTGQFRVRPGSRESLRLHAFCG